MEHGLTKQQIIQELAKSPHGELSEYVPAGRAAALEQPEFLAHLVAWNQRNGSVRDAKVALPVLALSATTHQEFTENALAHIAMLDPRNFLRAALFAKEQHIAVRRVRRLAERFLRAREENWTWWERSAVQHRASMKELYRYFHVKPEARADLILFKGDYPVGSVFDLIRNLKNMTPTEAAGTILEKRIPFLITLGALGEKAKEPDLVMALIQRMTPAELVTNTKRLEKLGIRAIPALRAAFEEALGKASTSKKAVLKTTVASEAVEDETVKAKLGALQEKQIAASKGIEGNWLVLGDKSGSMRACIEAARHVAATLAKFVKGEVHLIFFDTSPRYIEATGKTYEALLDETRHVTADGGTSIGCGMQYAIGKPLDIDGIAIVSDGGENNPPVFAERYAAYCKKTGKEPAVYLYHLQGDANVFAHNMKAAGVGFTTFEITGQDYYSLPNIIATMRANPYSLLDEIMAAPLVKLTSVLPLRKEESLSYV